MAYDNVVFPQLKLIHGFKKSIINPVGVVQNGAREFRLKKVAYERYQWSYPGRTLIQADKQTMVQFFLARGGSMNSFKFQDPDMPKFVNHPLTWVGVDPAAPTYSLYAFNLPAATGVSGTHPLYSYDPSMTVTLGGSGKAWTYKLHPTTGLPMLSVIGPTANDVRVTGNIYFTARFDSDLSYTLEALNVDNTTAIAGMSDINLVEVFEGTLT